MIEVEKKFRPTTEQLQALLKDCQFIKEVVNNDIVYDYPDYRLIKKDVRLRKRNGNFELKIGNIGGGEDEESVATEIEDVEEIKKYFGIDVSLEKFVAENFIEAMKIVTSRKKYKKDNFNIDVDKLDFGYECVEIELLVKEKSEAGKAYEDIIEFAKKYNFEIKHVPPKKKEYFRIAKPKVYNEIYGKER